MIRKEVFILMDLSNINYQDIINLYAQILTVSMTIGLIWALLEKLVIMFYDAVTDRWRDKRGGL